jgi:hypothetical protein
MGIDVGWWRGKAAVGFGPEVRFASQEDTFFLVIDAYDSMFPPTLEIKEGAKPEKSNKATLGLISNGIVKPLGQNVLLAAQLAEIWHKTSVDCENLVKSSNLRISLMQYIEKHSKE